MIENVNLRDQIYEILREMILRREIVPGQKIIEEELAKKIGVSRTPLREALCRLENDRIVEILPRRGASVRELSRETIIETLEIREVLEGLITRLATQNQTKRIITQLKTCLNNIIQVPDTPDNLIRFSHADEKFHAILLHASRNEMLMNYMANIDMHMRFIRIRTVTIPKRAKKTVAEHYKILDAIESRDANKAEKMMRQHNASVRKWAIENMDLILQPPVL